MNEIPIATVLKTNIRKYRIELGWSQEKLAEKAEICTSYVTQIELGNRSPSIDIIEKIATALGIEYRVLFTPENSAEKFFCLKFLENNVIKAVNKAIENEFSK